MKSFRTVRIAAATLVLAGITGLAACGSDDAPAPVAQDQSYAGPGSKWDVTLAGDGTFAMAKRANAAASIDFTVSGTWETSNGGFRLLTVTGGTGSGGPSIGDTAWAIDVPGYALLLKPIGSSEQLIPMVKSGSCPTANVAANWVTVRRSSTSDATDATRDYFGTYAYNATASTASLPVKYALGGGFANLGDNAIGPVNCQNGLNELPQADGLMYLTNNGGAIVHTDISVPGGSMFIFALAQKAISNVSNFDGQFVGMLFDDSSNSGNKISASSMVCSAGVCNGKMLAGPEDGASESNAWTLTLDGTVDALAPGLITGTLTDDASSNSGAVACMVDIDVLDSGKKIISCVAQAPDDNTKMGNVIFTSK